MPPTLTEAEVEAILLDQLQGLGYACLNDTVSGPDGRSPEREPYSDTILARRLRAAVALQNSHAQPDYSTDFPFNLTLLPVPGRACANARDADQAFRQKHPRGEAKAHVGELRVAGPDTNPEEAIA